MTLTLLDRIKRTACRWIGHREERDEFAGSVSCKRCRRLLGALNA